MGRGQSVAAALASEFRFDSGRAGEAEGKPGRAVQPAPKRARARDPGRMDQPVSLPWPGEDVGKRPAACRRSTP